MEPVVDPKKPKIAMITESMILGTGFSNVANQLLMRLAQDGYDTTCWATAYNGLQMRVNGVQLFALRKTSDVADLQGVIKPDIIVVLGSWHFLQVLSQNTSKTWDGKVLGYIVLDVPPLTDFGEDLKLCNKVITPSHFSANLFKKHYGVDADVIPHGVDLENYKCLEKPPMDKEFRYIVMASNVLRKMVPRAMRAMKKVSDWGMKRGMESKMMLFTNPGQEGGFKLQSMRKMMGLTKVVEFPSRLISSVGVPWSQMSVMYNLAHIHVSPTSGESFGLPYLEASACGLPTITTDAGAAREVLGDAGFYIPAYDSLDTDYGVLALVSVDLLADAMFKKALEYRLSPEAYAHDSREAVERAKLFPWSKGYEGFRKVIDTL